MTRRELLSATSAAIVVPKLPDEPLIVPVQHVLDGRVKWKPEQIQRFRSHIWPEAVRDFQRCGICLESRERAGEIRRSPSGKPLFTGLEPGMINFAITNRIPLDWDRGRGLNGVTTWYRGYHLCVVGLDQAHGHQIPMLSVNTCVHELLHVLLQDVFESRPKGSRGVAREFLIDWYATRLWLLHEGSAIQKAAQVYVKRLRSTLS